MTNFTEYYVAGIAYMKENALYADGALDAEVQERLIAFSSLLLTFVDRFLTPDEARAFAGVCRTIYIQGYRDGQADTTSRRLLSKE